MWTAARASPAIKGATIELTQDSATLHTQRHHLARHKRKDVFQVLREAIHTRHLGELKTSADQGRAFDSVSLHPDSTFFMYTGAFLSFPQYPFIHRAWLNLLPVRTVQARCRGRWSPAPHAKSVEGCLKHWPTSSITATKTWG